MPSTKIVRQIKKASVSEQIEIMELLFHSLRTKIETERKSTRKPFRHFRIRKFSLGEEIHADRDEMYSGRGL